MSDPYLRLAEAVLSRAFLDARRGSPEHGEDARVFLLIDAPRYWLPGLGVNIDHRAWRAWVLNHCPTAVRQKRVITRSRRSRAGSAKLENEVKT
jgi:hypothetical protein